MQQGSLACHSKTQAQFHDDRHAGSPHQSKTGIRVWQGGTSAAGGFPIQFVPQLIVIMPKTPVPGLIND
jgi:hypothetical protein